MSEQLYVDKSKKRIGYIDALRGFTMILVVAYHVSSDCKTPIYLMEFFNLYRMPLFFFISGFILYKKCFVWNGANLHIFLRKKFMIQIIPTVLFLGLYNFVFSIPDLSPTYNGYWFTLALFMYFMLYSVIRFYVGEHEKTALLLLLLLGLVSYAVSFRVLPQTIMYLTVPMGFLIFFVIGIVARKYFERMCNLMNNVNVMAVVITLFLIVSILFCNGYLVYLPIRIMLVIIGIISIFYFFMKNEEYMDNSRVGKSLQFIGRRTLDIYLLHYFFIQNSMSWVKDFSIEQPLILFVISLCTALLIIGVCLIISKFIRTNQLLGKLLFGAKC